MALRSALVESQKVAAIVGQQDAAIGGCKGQHLGVRYRCVRLSRLVRGQDVVTQEAQFLHNLKGDVFVGIETSH